MTIDAYKVFLKKFDIDEEEFIKHGIQQVQMIHQSTVIKEWNRLKDNILSGKADVHIRSYGVKGQNSHLFLGIYNDYFKNAKILIDKTNNQKAQKMIYNLLDLQTCLTLTPNIEFNV